MPVTVRLLSLALIHAITKPVKLSDKDDPSPSSKEDSEDLDDCVFELSIKGGQQRLWRASSRKERDNWVRSINTAMIGSAGDFTIDGSDPTDHTIYVPQSPMMVTSQKKAGTGKSSAANAGHGASTTSRSGDSVNTPSGASNNVDLNLGLDLYLSDKHRDSRANTRKSPIY